MLLVLWTIVLVEILWAGDALLDHQLEQQPLNYV